MDIPNTDLDAINEVVKDQNAEASLPCNLSIDLIYQIARDSMLFNIANEANDDDADVPYGGAMCLVFHLIVMRSQKLFGATDCAISLDRMGYWIERYFYYVELELRCRINNTPRPKDAQALMAEIDSELNTIHGKTA
jgi:hypothetical protein